LKRDLGLLAGGEMFDNYRPRSSVSLHTIILAAAVALIPIGLLSGCPNMLGWNKSAAEKHAKEWARSMGLQQSKVVCGSSDTDGDGYVSCAFHIGDDVRTFECAGWALIIPHDGCREPKIKVPAMRGSSR